jgi:ABC-type antimicrobial peptide transport system ATPase subunit
MNAWKGQTRVVLAEPWTSMQQRIVAMFWGELKEAAP